MTVTVAGRPLFDQRVRFRIESELPARACEGTLFKTGRQRFLPFDVVTLDVYRADPRTDDPDVGLAVKVDVGAPRVWLTSEFSTPMLVVDVKTLTEFEVYAAVRAWCRSVDLTFRGGQR